MQNLEKFDDIRPFHDSEANQVLNDLVREPEFIDVIVSMRFADSPKLFYPVLRCLVKRHLKKLLSHIHNVYEFQQYIKEGMQHLLDESDSKITSSGLEKLDPKKPYLFLSNHRDIAMDPASVNFVRDEHQMDTVRIAIGDNLLSKKYISDLIRVNKSFVVKRSVTGKRAMLEALKTLSEYIRMSITEDASSVWIAQREGRAKDGCDKAEPALLKMLGLSKTKEQSFTDALVELNVVPVAVSYQFDPCDIDKARELYQKQVEGTYVKGEHEDLQSIYKGIVGYKGHVHVAFGEPITQGFSNADELASLVDNFVYNNYYLHPTNILAYEMLSGEDEFSQAQRSLLSGQDWQAVGAKFAERVNSCDEQYRDILLQAYANPVYAKQRLLGE